MLKLFMGISVLLICLLASMIPPLEAKYDPNVVWKAIPNSSQELAHDSRADITFYFGTRGPGKTSTQLMFFRKYVGIGYGSFLKGILFDLEYKHLGDVIAQAKRFFLPFGDCKYVGGNECKFVWVTGEELLFRHAKTIFDYDDYHGHEYPIIMYNEICKWAVLDFYDKMMSTNRSSFTPLRDTPILKNGNFATSNGKPLPKIPLKVFITGNPNGPGHNAVKSRFITCCPVGTMLVTETLVFNPATQKEEICKKTQIAIFGSYKENIYLDPAYIASLHELTKNNPNLEQAWLYGSWDHNSGGCFDDIWDSNIHVMPRFKIPSNWFINRSFDWGSTHPFWVGWWAEANGESVTLEDGSLFTPVRGSKFQIFEWYGTEKIGSNKGIMMSSADIAEGIKIREEIMLENGWISSIPHDGPADTQIGQTREEDVETIKKKMEDKGISWTDADKSKGSRVIGFQLFRDMLKSATTGEGEGIYFFNICRGSVETVPNLPRDDKNPDDVMTTAEDHPWDGIRYEILEGKNRIADSLDLRMFT